MPNVRIDLDQAVPLSAQPGKGHNRWHPDIPPAVCVAPGTVVEMTTRDGLDGQVTPTSTAADLSTVDMGPPDFARHQTPALLIAVLAVFAAAAGIGSLDVPQVTLTEMLIRVLVGVGLYVFIGNSGVSSFGQVGFMCIGAYAAGWATAEPSFKQVMLQGLPAMLQEDGSGELGLGVLLALILIFRPNGIAGGKEIAVIRGPRGMLPESGSAASARALQSDSNAVA